MSEYTFDVLWMLESITKTIMMLSISMACVYFIKNK